VIRDLTDARQRLDAGDWKGSIRASRNAAEVLRSMHAEQLNPKKTLRNVDEREAAILDAERQLIHSQRRRRALGHHLRGVSMKWRLDRRGPIRQPAPAAGTNRASPPPGASRTAKNRPAGMRHPGRPGCAAYASQASSLVPA
jgi:hypothetical protein